MLKHHTLALAPCVNVHPGLLPRVRGAFPQCWSILEDLPIGCTCYLLDEGIDTGPILRCKEVSVSRGDSLDRVVNRTMFASSELMLEVVRDLDYLRTLATPQASYEGKTYHWPTADELEMARQRLARGDYRWLIPRS